MKCLVQQMKQIAATCHSNDHLWAGPWTLIWSASSWRTAAAHSNKCSRMQPQSSSHYPPAAAKRDFSSSEHCRSTSSICTSHGADSTSTSKGGVKSLKSSLYPWRSEKRALNSSRSWVTMPTCTDTSSGEQARRRLKCVKSDFISWDSHSLNLTSKAVMRDTISGIRMPFPWSWILRSFRWDVISVRKARSHNQPGSLNSGKSASLLHKKADISFRRLYSRSSIRPRLSHRTSQ